MTDPATYIVSEITPEDPGAGFACGNHDLDDYFRRHALSNHTNGIGHTFVIRPAAPNVHQLPPVLGFYTWSMAALHSAQAQRSVPARLPAYPMPVALIGRFAIATAAQRRGLGERLLMHAFDQALDLSRRIGCIGIIVDAKNLDAERFYSAYDFSTVTADSWPHRMFLPMATVRNALAES